MARTYFKGSLVDYAFCRPEHLRLAVPAVPQTLPQIMANYPLLWARASNAGYFAGPGIGEGVMADEGTRYPSRHIPGRPVLYVDNGRAWFETYSTVPTPTRPQMAIEAGPMLLPCGDVSSLTWLIREGKYSGFDATTKRQQVGVGLTGDGRIMHVVALALSLVELAALMRQHGCVDAMKMDGGGSTGLMESSRFTLGYRTRLLPNALVMTELIGERVPKRLKVMLDPGGTDSCGTMTGIREGEVTLDVARRAREELRRAGADCDLTTEEPDETSIQERIDRSNSGNYDCLISIHCNGASFKDGTPNPGPRGVEAFHWHASDAGRMLAELLVEEVCRATGLPKRPYPVLASHVGESRYYRLLKYTNPPAAIAEVGSLTNPMMSSWCVTLLDGHRRPVVCSRESLTWSHMSSGDLDLEGHGSKSLLSMSRMSLRSVCTSQRTSGVSRCSTNADA